MPHLDPTGNDSSRPGMRRTVGSEIADIAGRYTAADQQLLRARTSDDQVAAEDERRQAMGDLWACRQQLAELLALMLRCLVEHDPGVLRDLLARPEILGADLDDLSHAVARLEEGSREPTR